LFESSQSLFWASFGAIGIENFELTGIKSYTRFWGLLMFGSYSVINVIVLLNLLIAMMSNSYAIIDVSTVLRHMNPVHTLKRYVPTIHPNIILGIIPSSAKWSSAFTLPCQNCMHAHLILFDLITLVILHEA
jgi:hypothetical protein